MRKQEWLHLLSLPMTWVILYLPSQQPGLHIIEGPGFLQGCTLPEDTARVPLNYKLGCYQSTLGPCAQGPIGEKRNHHIGSGN